MDCIFPMDNILPMDSIFPGFCGNTIPSKAQQDISPPKGHSPARDLELLQIGGQFVYILSLEAAEDAAGFAGPLDSRQRGFSLYLL